MTEKNIWDYFLKIIKNEYGVAGLMGNLEAESGLVSNNLQNSYEKKLGMTDAQYTAAVDNKKYTNFVSDKAGYGYAQWTSANRKQGLLNYAIATHRSIGNAQMQLEYLIQELELSYKGVFNTLKKATSVAEASDVVVLKYEVPGSVLPSAGEASKQKTLAVRRAKAQAFYDKYASSSKDTIKNYDLIFNYKYYADKYPDLKAAFGYNKAQLKNHFTTYGMKEGRQAISTFNVITYKNNYADLRAAFGDDLPKYYEHYVNYGYKEKRQA